ncbi:MAG: hypothetical protein CMP23_15995 [Rickettsiales bacterium]|nr:hypothetical protein [Rickettsiales bacterium]|tara:strand:- start:168 stop:779 length:612 start_codon:yes stop_codon:yes gene_type:complete
MLVFFDLGGVVVDVNLNWARQAWARSTAQAPTEFNRIFLDSGLKDLIDRGQLSADAAIERVQQASETPVSAEQIRSCWSACLRKRPSSTRLVHEVARKSRCAVLSNTDPIHSAWLEANTGINPAIEHWVYSYQCHALKPEPEIYRFALEQLKIPATQALLIDDRAENIAAARSMGMDTIHFDRLDQVVSALAARDLLAVSWQP